MLTDIDRRRLVVMKWRYANRLDEQGFTFAEVARLLFFRWAYAHGILTEVTE